MANLFKSLLKAATPALGNIPIVGGIIQGAAQDYLNKEEQADALKQQYNYQTSLMGAQQAMNKEMFNMQLEANKHSIVDQFAQYKQLGISPLAVGGMQQTNMASPAGVGIAPAHEPQSPLQSAQIDLMRSEAKLNNKEADSINPNLQKSQEALNESQSAVNWSVAKTNEALRDNLIKLSNGDVQLQDIKRRYDEKSLVLLSHEIDNTEALTANYKSQVRLNDKQVEAINKNMVLDEMRTMAEIKHWNNQDQAQFRELALKAQEVSQFIKESNQRIENLKSTKNLTDAQARTEYWNSAEIKKRCDILNLQYDEATQTTDWRIKATNAEFRYKFAVAENGELQTEFNTQFLNENWDDLQNMRYIDDCLSSLHVGFNFGGFANFNTSVSRSDVRSTSKSESKVTSNSKSENTNFSFEDPRKLKMQQDGNYYSNERFNHNYNYRRYRY